MNIICIDPNTPAFQIEILPELRDRLPSLSNRELDELDRALTTEGCTEPLDLWAFDGRHIILDGHHRYALCSAHGIPFRVRIKTVSEIPDVEAALDWIDRHQLARRNMPPDLFQLVLGRVYNREKKHCGGTGANQHIEQRVQNEHAAPTRTSDRVAKEYGVSASTVRRAGQFAEAVEMAKEHDPDIEAKVVRGEVTRREVLNKAKPPTKSEVADVPSMLDGDGREIPKHLEAVFAQAERFQAFAQQASTLKGQVRKAIEANPAAWSRFNENQFRSSISQVFDLLKLSGPFIVCSYCGGVDSGNCTGCKGTGFLSEAQARCVPPEFRPQNQKEMK